MIETALAVPITGNFETLGSKFSNETRLARLLASLLQIGNSIKLNPLYYKRLFNSSASSSNPGLPNKANIFFLYASTPG